MFVCGASHSIVTNCNTKTIFILYLFRLLRAYCLNYESNASNTRVLPSLIISKNHGNLLIETFSGGTYSFFISAFISDFSAHPANYDIVLCCVIDIVGKRYNNIVLLYIEYA